MSIIRNISSINVSLVILFCALFFYGEIILFSLIYITVFLFVSFRALQSISRKRTRFFLIVAYLVVMLLQMVFYHQNVADYNNWFEHPFRKFLAIAILLFPMMVSRYVAVNKYTELYLPTFQETITISFSQIREFTDVVSHAVSTVKKTGGRLTPGNLGNILESLPRHDSFRYINSGSLTDEYFRTAEENLDDPNLYIIISNTGTPASEIVSVFTQKQFNHASIAFDGMLKTIISYNGGDRVYPPGLNNEMLDYFNKKPDASILVYRLPVSREQKRKALDKIVQINLEGSAYNLMGLLISRSYRPNIMYCSQFVYHIIQHIGASYFKADGVIKPTDFIEKDYFRKLVFVEEIKLN